MTKRVMFTLALGCSLTLPPSVATGFPQATESAKGEEIFQSRCSSCHGTERAIAVSRTRKGWEIVLTDMQNIGVPLETAEVEPLLAFLTTQHGLVNVNTAKPADLVALGLSQKDADTIVKHRTDRGPFADYAALRAVPGIDVERLDAVGGGVAFRD